MRFDTAHGVELSRVEVDFHIPELEQDTRIAIDPFLMFKSRHPELVNWHRHLIDYWNHVLDLIKGMQYDKAALTLQCPEPTEIRMGYTAEGTSGSGIGPEIASGLVNLIKDNGALLTRGIRHLEELQLYSVGIGADRLSDLVANVLKVDLVRYTAQQARLWSLPLAENIGIPHVWDDTSLEWVDLLTTVPVDPETGSPVLLVPRRVVRRLPWINYEDFKSHYLLSFLAARGVSSRGGTKKKVVELTRSDLGLVDQYIEIKETKSAEAAPVDLDDRDRVQIDRQADVFAEELETIRPGTADALKYEDVCLRMINSALEPQLIDGRRQERTYEGTQIRDLIYINDSDHSFWTFVRNAHASLFVTFEVKNKLELAPADLNQMHAYLGDSTGYLGFVISRNGFRTSDHRRAAALYNRRSPHSVILGLSDADLTSLLRWKKTDSGPTERIRDIYRRFLTALQ